MFTPSSSLRLPIKEGVHPLGQITTALTSSLYILSLTCLCINTYLTSMFWILYGGQKGKGEAHTLLPRVVSSSELENYTVGAQGTNCVAPTFEEPCMQTL